MKHIHTIKEGKALGKFIYYILGVSALAMINLNCAKFESTEASLTSEADVVDFKDDEFLKTSEEDLSQRKFVSQQELMTQTKIESSSFLDDGKFLHIGDENSQGLKISQKQQGENLRIHLGKYITSDYYVPQGVASSCEAQTRSCTNEVAYVSMFWKYINGKTASSSYHASKKSIVVAYDVNRRRSLGCYMLDNYSHAGGIAYFQTNKGNKNIYVSSGGAIHLYELPRQTQFPSSGCINLKRKKYWYVKASSFISMVFINGRRSLLVGRFCSKSGSTSACHYRNGSRARPYAYQYLLSEDGEIVRYRRKGSGTNFDNEWLTKYRLPYKTQGVDVVGNYIVMSMSYGNSPSHYYKDALRLYNCPYGKSCNLPNRLWTKLKYRYLRGGEDLASTPGGVWTVSESAAKYYLKAWGGKGLPYIYRLNR